MRIGRFLGVLAGVAGTALAAGCGTQHGLSPASQAPDLSAAVSHTHDQTARVASTISMRTQGMTVHYSSVGVFDFARSRGTMTMTMVAPSGGALPAPGAVRITEVYLPPTTYVKLPAAGSALPKGKTWVGLPDGNADANGMLLFGGSGDPADLLAWLAAMPGAVTRIGASTVRGVPVTGFALTIDPAKAAAKIPADRVGLVSLARDLGATAISLDVWVDGQNRVRREQLTLLAANDGTGASPKTHVVITTDFYDFGVPVRVTAPPAAQVASQSAAFGGASGSSSSGSGWASASGSASASASASAPASGTGAFFGTSASASPPPASGTLDPAQAAAAEQAVAAFWAGLGRNDAAAVAQTVLPGQRSCVPGLVGGGAPAITVSGLHIMSAQPAGNSSATVRFALKAHTSMGGQTIPVFPQEPGSPQWLVTTRVAGRWYVNLADSTAYATIGGCDQPGGSQG